MATESPLIVDGAQCQAAANLWNPAVALAGPFGSGQFLGVYLSSSRTVAIQTSAGGQIYGVLQNTPTLGGAANVGIIGITKAVAGAAITTGWELMLDTSGRFVHWTASSHYKVGLALEDAGAVNNVFTMLIYNPNIVVLT